MTFVRLVLSGALSATLAAAAPAAAEYYYDGFENHEKLADCGSMRESRDPDWWLSSGGYFYERRGSASTIVGELASDDPMRRGYRDVNPRDTDDGYRPQNIFRLVSKKKWTSGRQQVYFDLQKVHTSSSPNRNESNGILLFNRYHDENELYYVGLRVDGNAVIKKKLDGRYTTLAVTRIYGRDPYDRWHRYNFLPGHRWLGLRSRIVTNDNGTVTIRMYLDQGHGFREVLEATDSSRPIQSAGYGGIRADFMDVEFAGYELSTR